METLPLVTTNLVVLNGKKYIAHFLDHLKAQTYPHHSIEVNILDNNSTDGTKELIKERLEEFSDFKTFNLIESDRNHWFWPGHEMLLSNSNGKYIIASAVDVLMDSKFIEMSVAAMEKDPEVGALQAKIYTYDINHLEARPLSKIIDTCGFEIYKSRKVLNIGHGQEDKGQFAEVMEIFAVEGAIPVFRKSTLDGIKVGKGFVDPDYLWYGDDLDFGWRINLFGWKQIMDPRVIAWHDRQTTKGAAEGLSSHLSRVKIRKQIPIKKRGLDWRNVRFTIIKNDYIVNVLKDLPRIAARELMVFIYTLLFEPGVFMQVPSFLKLLPKMLGRRREIMGKACRSPDEIRRWFR